jgi:DNA processing protein
MADLETQKLWLALRLAAGMTRPRFYTLISRFGTPGRVFGAGAKELSRLRGFDNELISSILEAPRTAPVEQELELMNRHGVRLVTSQDDDYPANFQTCSFPPPLIYVRGTLQSSDRYSVALVGSRQATQYGRGVAREIAGRLAACGITVISGFARGVDSEAHHAALKAGARTIGVLGNGLAVCYPAENRALADRIVASGALISEYPMETAPERFNFPERNRLIATFSLGTVVIEAAEKSGALITSREAIEENRFVFAVPGDITRLSSRGSNALIQNGARLVQRAEDILYEMKDILRGYLREELLNPPDETAQPQAHDVSAAAAQVASHSSSTDPTSLPPKDSEKSGGAFAFFNASSEELLVLQLLQREPHVFDALAAQLTPQPLSVQRLSALLLNLELKQQIRQLPGRNYAVFA